MNYNCTCCGGGFDGNGDCPSYCEGTVINGRCDLHRAPETCKYCDGKGHTGSPDSRNECGFCDNGNPLDTQEDWDRTWGWVLGEDE